MFSPTEIGVLINSAEIEFFDSEPVKPDTDNAVVGNFSNEIKQFIADYANGFRWRIFIFKEVGFNERINKSKKKRGYKKACYECSYAWRRNYS